jgi:D-glycero-alpha-D-manno-heptose-7-phosphate kinase
LDLIKALMIKFKGNMSKGFDLLLHRDAPPGSGLGSSSTIMVALVSLLKE